MSLASIASNVISDIMEDNTTTSTQSCDGVKSANTLVESMSDLHLTEKQHGRVPAHLTRDEYIQECRIRAVEQGVQLLFGEWDSDMVVVNKPTGIPVFAMNRDNLTERICQIVGHKDVYLVR